MSVDRATLARVNGVTEEEVKCEYCDGYDYYRCNFWRQTTKPGSFCSFYDKKKEETNERDQEKK